MTADDAAVPSDLLGPRLPSPSSTPRGPRSRRRSTSAARAAPRWERPRAAVCAPRPRTRSGGATPRGGRWRMRSAGSVPPDCDRAGDPRGAPGDVPARVPPAPFLQRAPATSVAMGRTLVPLPPYDRGFEHVFQPVTNCSLREARSARPRRRRGRLARALATLSDVLLASGAPHEKLHPLLETKALVYKIWPAEDARKKNGGDVEEDARGVGVARDVPQAPPAPRPGHGGGGVVRSREGPPGGAGREAIGHGRLGRQGGERGVARRREGARGGTHRRRRGRRRQNHRPLVGEEGGGSVVACSNGRCDHAWGRGRVRPAGGVREGRHDADARGAVGGGRGRVLPRARAGPKRDRAGPKRRGRRRRRRRRRGGRSRRRGRRSRRRASSSEGRRLRSVLLRFAPTAADLAALERGTTASAWARVGRATLDRLTSSAEAVLPLPGHAV